MKLLLYGLNKDAMTFEEGKTSNFEPTEIKNQRKTIREMNGVRELFIFNNEFRIEYYLLVDEQKFQHGDLLTFLAEVFNKSIDRMIIESYSKYNQDFILHLYQLISGMQTEVSEQDQIIDNFEESILLAIDQKKEMPFLLGLIKHVIHFISERKGYETYPSLFSKGQDMILQELSKLSKEFWSQRFFLFGEVTPMKALAKALHRNGAKHITVFNGDADESVKVAQELQNWADEIYTEKAGKIFYAFPEFKQYAYYLAASDILISLDAHVLKDKIPPFLRNEIQNEVDNIRYFEKNQWLISTEDLPENILEDFNSSIIKITNLNSNASILQEEKIYNEKLAFEEDYASDAKELYEVYEKYNKKYS